MTRGLRIAILVFAVGVAAGIALLAAGQSRADKGKSAQASDPGPTDIVLFQNLKPAPALQVNTLEGAPLDLAAYRGRVVLLNFWATWCGPCRQEIPDLIRIQKNYAGKVQVIGMSIDEIPPAQVKAKAASLGLNYPVAMATDAIQERFGGAGEIPLTFVIGPKGEIEQKLYGANPYGIFENDVRVLSNMPVTAKVVRIDQLSPHGKVGTVNIPGIAELLKALTPAQRAKALAALNDNSCSCPCGYSLASCRVEEPSCGFSLPEARQIIEAIKAGKTP